MWAGLLLTIHTLVPHVHGETNVGGMRLPAVEAPHQLSGWLEILGDLVNGDMGEEHLEHFAPEKTVVFTLALVPSFQALPLANFAEVPYPLSACSKLRKNIDAPPSLEKTAAHLRYFAPRGPPTVA